MKTTIAILASLFMLSSCSTDFDTTADYKEIMVVYGLLNQYDSTHQWIKVNKAFLGEGNALIMADVRDSINYGDILEVTLDKIDNGVITATYTLQRDTTLPREEGIFHNPYQVLYRLDGHPLSVNSQYRIKVRNTQTGMEATSQSSVLGNCVVNEPDPLDKFSFISPLYPSVQLDSAARARVYSLIIRFHYTEVENFTGNTTGKYFDWQFADKVNDPPAPGIIFTIPGPDFYYTVGQNIPIDTHVIRHVGNTDIAGGLPIEILISAGSADLERYMELSAPSNTVVQEIPLFNNINNGVGLFTGRLQFSTFRDMTNGSKLALDTNQYTKDLNFQ